MATPTHHPQAVSRPYFGRFITTALSSLLFATMVAFAHAAADAPLSAPKDFDIPAADASVALKQYTTQSGQQLIYSTEEVSGVKTNAVHGTMNAGEALDHLLAGTGLSATHDEQTGAVAVGRKEEAKKNVLSRSDMRASTAERSGDEVIQLSAFQVSTDRDRGYRASNSVTGSRVDTPIKDLPFAIQAFTSEFIKDTRPNGLADLIRYAPGVVARNDGFTTGDTNFAIRGFAIGAFNTALRDGLIGPSTFSFNATDRVEIIKGPASFLYGQLAPGGMINVITKTPLQKFDNTLSLTAGLYDKFEAQLDYGGKIGKTGFSYRLPLLYNKDISYWSPYEAHTQDIAPSVAWSNDRVSVVLQYEQYKKIETPPLAEYPMFFYGNPAGSVNTPLTFLGPKFNLSSYLDRRSSENNELTGTINVKLSEHWSARARYGYSWSKVFYLFTGEPWVTSWYANLYNNYTITRWSKQQYNEGVTDSYEGDLVGKYNWGDTSLRMLLGYSDVKHTYYQWGRGRGAWDAAFWDLKNPATWDRDYYGSLKDSLDWGQGVDWLRDKGAYVGLTLGLFKERLLLLAGGRRTDSTVGSHSETWDYRPDNQRGSIPYGYSTRDLYRFNTKATTPQLGALYKITPEISAFFSYAESFVPSHDYLAKAWVPTSPAKPTRGVGYETGLKTSLLNGRVSATLTFYNIENRDQIRRVSYEQNGAIMQDVVQSGVDESKGMEFDINYSPTDNLQIYASYAYNNAKVKSDVGDPARVGRHLIDSVPNTANLWFRYDFKEGLLKNAFVGGGFNYVGGVYYDQDPTSYREYYTLYNAMAGYAFKARGMPMALTLNVKNITNKFYRPGNQGNGRPREIELTLTTRF